MSSIVEVNLGHFSTSLPNLRPILDFLTGRKPSTSTYNTRPSHVPDRYLNLEGRSDRSRVEDSHDTETLILEERERERETVGMTVKAESVMTKSPEC